MSQRSAPDDGLALPDRLSAPARRALAANGVTRLDQLARMTEVDALALHGMGPKAASVLRAALDDVGLAFAASD